MNLYDMGVSKELVLKITKANIRIAMSLKPILVNGVRFTRMQWENQGGE